MVFDGSGGQSHSATKCFSSSSTVSTPPPRGEAGRGRESGDGRKERRIPRELSPVAAGLIYRAQHCHIYMLSIFPARNFPVVVAVAV